MSVSNTACLDSSVKLGKNVRIGPYSVIGPNVQIGDDSIIGSHTVIEKNTTLGKCNRVHSFVSLGSDPQDMSYEGGDTWLEIGDHNVIREYVSINRASMKENFKTVVGDHNCFLAYSHVAHDCVIGDNVMFINNATIAGHVHVGDKAIIGAFVAIHQFCHVGAYGFVAQGSQLGQDVPPYVIVAGTPGRPCGLNVVGLRRHGFSNKVISALREAYLILYNRELLLEDALIKLEILAVETPEIEALIHFVRSSKRGISRRVVERSKVGI